MSLIPHRRKKVWQWEPLGYDDDPFEAGSFMATKNRCASTETRTWWEWLRREWFVKDIERFDPAPDPADYDPSEAELIRYYHSGGGEDPVSRQQIRDAGRPGL